MAKQMDSLFTMISNAVQFLSPIHQTLNIKILRKSYEPGIQNGGRKIVQVLGGGYKEEISIFKSNVNSIFLQTIYSIFEKKSIFAQNSFWNKTNGAF